MSYKLKILSGPLRGSEFDLPDGEVVLLIGDNANLRIDSSRARKAASELATVLSIPHAVSGPDLLIFTEADEALNADRPDSSRNHPGSEKDRLPVSVTVFPLDDSIPEQQEIELNQATSFGELWIALLPEYEIWSPEVCAFQPPEPVQPFQPPPSQLIHAVTSSEREIGNLQGPSARVKLIRSGIALMLILLVGCSVAIWYSWTGLSTINDQHAQQGIQKSLSAIGEVPLTGRDGLTYIVIDDGRRVSWLHRELLIRDIPTQSVRVLSSDQEVRRIEALLDQDDIRFFTVRLDNPQTPKVILSRERNRLDAPALQTLKRALLTQIPYADKVELSMVSDLSVRNEAVAWLDQAAVPYSMENHRDSSVLTIRRLSDDQKIISLSTLIESFRGLWGDRFVRFAIEMGDDPLRDKSFKAGSHSYVMESPSHWRFSTITLGPG